MLKAVIALIAAGIVIGGWTAAFQQIRYERIEAEAAAIQQVQNRVMAFEQYVARTFEAANLITSHVGEKFLRGDYARGSMVDVRPTRIEDAIIDRTLFAAVHVVNPGGDIIASTAALGRGVNIADHPAFRSQVAARSDDLQITAPFKSTILPGTYVNASRRIRDAGGRVTGFASAQIRPAILSDFLKDASFKDTDLISVITLNGITLARREGDRITFGEDLRGKLVMRMQMKNPNGTYVGPSSIDGLVRYFSHRRLKDYPIFVTSGMSRDAAMAPVKARARMYHIVMAALTVATLLIASLTFLTLSRRHRRTEDLAEANRRLSQAQRVAKIGDWEYEVASGAVIWSDQLCEMYGRDARDDHMTIEEFGDYLNEEDRTVVGKAIAEAIRTSEPQAYEFQAHLPDGTITDRYAIAVPTFDENGMVRAVHGTDQDITAERMLRSLQGQVAHLARVDAMNTMAATLAHELNQPLTAASNYLAGGERLVKKAEDNPLLLEALQSTKRQIHLAGQIIRRVRDMLGSQSSLSQQTKLSEAIDDALSLLRAAGGHARLSVERDLDPDAELVWADPIQIQQVLLNLLRNAQEAANEKPKPTIRISSRSQDDGYVMVLVADNGAGIARPLGEIFSPFSSDKEEGLGLGLSISRTIVEYHGGRIWVEKSDASGTTLAFTLPKSRPPAN